MNCGCFDSSTIFFTLGLEGTIFLSPYANYLCGELSLLDL